MLSSVFLVALGSLHAQGLQTTTLAALHPIPELVAVNSANIKSAAEIAKLPAESRSVTGSKASVEASKNFFAGADSPRLLGDWHDWRSELAAHGIDFTGYWTGIVSANPVGGKKEGHATTVDDTFIVAHFDLDRILRIPHGGLQLSFIDRGGRGLSNEYIGGQFNVQQCVGGQSPFFYQAFLEQHLAANRLYYKAGRFSASDDMNASPFYGLSLNNGIDGDIRNVLFDTQSSAYPFPTWGGYLRVELPRHFAYKTAIFQTTAQVFNPAHHGLDWGIHNGDSAITMNEFVWEPKAHAKDLSGATAELPGHYWIGSTYTPWKGFTQFLSPTKVGNSYGFYLHADQMLYRPSATGKANVSLWTAAAYYPQQNIAIVPIQINVGLVDQGRIHSRPDDKTFLGFIYGQFSRDWAKKQVALGNGNPSHEMVVELAHRLQLARHTFLQPDLQYQIRPAGTGRIPSALVLGAELGITF